MRTGLIIFGIIFLILGGLLYLMPMQKISADTTTSNGENVDERTSSARLTVPVEWAYSTGIIGGVLLILGFMIPNPQKDHSRKDSYNKVVETKEHTKVGNNGHERKITQEKTESHKSR